MLEKEAPAPLPPERDPPADNGKPDGPQRVMRSYLLLAGLYTLSASIIWGVNTLFLLNAGLDIQGVFVANAIFTASMAVFEIPTGVLADTRGRRASFLLSVAVIFLGTLGYVGTAAIGGGLLLFSLWSIVLGLGYTFYSGATEAWLVDALKASGYEGELDQVFATSSIVTTAAMLVGTVSGGVLGSIDLAVPFLVRSVLLVAVFVIAFFTMHDMGFTPKAMQLAAMPSEMKRIARASVTYGWENRSVRLLIVAGFFQASFMAWGFHAWQPYFLDLLGQNLTWVAGLIAAFVSLAMIAGNSVVEWFTRYCGKRTTLLLWSLGIQVIATIGVGLVDSFWLAVPLYLISMAALGVWSPVRQAYIHKIIPSEQRATVISFDSLVTSSGSAVAQFSLGRLAQTRSIAVGYVIGGITMAIALPFVYRLRKRGDEADIIVGTAGKQGACPVQGIPQVSAIDSNAGLADT